jgi:hypothetical protein
LKDPNLIFVHVLYDFYMKNRIDPQITLVQNGQEHRELGNTEPMKGEGDQDPEIGVEEEDKIQSTDSVYYIDLGAPQRSKDSHRVPSGIERLIGDLGIVIGIAGPDMKEFGEENLENTGAQDVPGGIDEEIDLELMELFAGLSGPIVGDGIGGLAEFTTGRPTPLRLNPGKEAVLVDMGDGAGAFTGLEKGLLRIVIETDSTTHGWRLRAPSTPQVFEHKVEAP